MRPAVTAIGLDLRFGETVALARSDFSLPGDGVSILIGPNGSGKSSVLSAIGGIHRPFAGSIEVLGTTPVQARPRVAYVLQSTKVNDALPVTVREVVAMGRFTSKGMVARLGYRDKEAIDEALARLDLVELQHRHLRELSGGQRQRVFVAQGLVQERDLLLLDEPTMALDLVSTGVIRQAINGERAAGRPVVVTTHDLSEAQQADHVLLLANRVVAAGPPGEVLTPESLSEAYRSDIGDLAGHLYLDDAAHQPADPRHTHVEGHPHP